MMPWMSDKQGLLLLRFLEIEPLMNNHGGLKMSYLCLYTSEMKNLNQFIETLEKIISGEWTEIAEKNQKRYQNTIANLGLILGEGNKVTLSQYGSELIEFMEKNSLSTSNLNHETDENKSASKNVEKIILKNLIKIISHDLPEYSKAREYGKKLLFNLNQFFENITESELTEVINDLDKLLFLQIINSSGIEIKRYFNMTEENRQKAFEVWSSLKNSSDFPSEIPSGEIERMAYFYTKPIHKGKTIQSEIRFRVSNCVAAYKEIVEENKIVIPKISRDYQVIQKITKSSSIAQFLPSKNNRNTLDIPNQLIVSGCPGSGKSWYLRELIESDSDAHVITITLHPEYNYSDFIGCYKPVPVYEESSNIVKASGDSFALGIPKINYEFVPGPFIDAYIRSIRNPNYNVVLKIEEINRANCNSLFGDVFQLLDRDDNNESEHEIETMPDLRDYLKAQGLSSTLKLPSNLFICGTMNSADQGVFPLDTAFRRRWEFEYKGYKTPCEYNDIDQNLTYGGNSINWDVFRGKINDALIKFGIHEDKLIGPYFLTTKELLNSDSILNKLFLFLWDDVMRFQRKEIFDFESFAELSDSWGDGSGTPLKIDMN